MSFHTGRTVDLSFLVRIIRSGHGGIKWWEYVNQR